MIWNWGLAIIISFLVNKTIFFVLDATFKEQLVKEYFYPNLYKNGVNGNGDNKRMRKSRKR